jgi:hypothetical protein
VSITAAASFGSRCCSCPGLNQSLPYVPDHKTVADFRKDNGRVIRQVCVRFVALCRTLGLFTEASVAIDGSKFRAVNNRDENFTRAKMERRMAQIEESVTRYLHQLDSADRQEPSLACTTTTTRLKEKIAKLKEEMQRLHALQARMLATPQQQISLTDPDARSMATSGRGSGVWATTSRSPSTTRCARHLINALPLDPLRWGKAAKLGKMAKHGHLAEVARRQCFCQGVFTRPRPKADTRALALALSSVSEDAAGALAARAERLVPQRSHRLPARMIVVIARLEEKIMSFGQVGEESRWMREVLQIFPAMFCFVLECEEEYRARSHYSPYACKAFLDDVRGKMCENGLRQDEVEMRIAEVSKERFASAAVDQSRFSCCEIFVPNKTVRIFDRLQ